MPVTSRPLPPDAPPIVTVGYDRQIRGVSLQDVRDLARLMRDEGITELELPGVKLWVPAPSVSRADFLAAATDAATLPAGDPVSRPDCPCGHSHAEHSDSGCLQGCPLTDCEPANA